MWKKKSDCLMVARKQRQSTACAADSLLLFLCPHLASSPWEGVIPFRVGLLALSEPSLDTPSQIHPEMCFTHLLGVSQSNQVESED
jgi:hypothetical protein